MRNIFYTMMSMCDDCDLETFRVELSWQFEVLCSGNQKLRQKKIGYKNENFLITTYFCKTFS